MQSVHSKSEHISKSSFHFGESERCIERRLVAVKWHMARGGWINKRGKWKEGRRAPLRLLRNSLWVDLRSNINMIPYEKEEKLCEILRAMSACSICILTEATNLQCLDPSCCFFTHFKM